MTITNRTRLALAASLLATAAHAQTGPGGGSFPRLSQGEMQAQRTAQLVAASQQPIPAPIYTSALPTSRATGRDSFTRTMQDDRLVMPRTETVPPPPLPVAYRDPAYAPAAAASSGVIPAMPDALPGECFALVRLPERYRSYQQEYELRAASERIETTPPQYETVTEQYIAHEAYERLEVLPASFRMVTERVETSAPSAYYTATEPVYETVTERILEQPARSVWKPGKGPIQRIDHATGEIMCLIEEPAVYKNISRRVLKTPAQTVEVPVPGQYSQVTRRVLERPAEVRRVVVPQQLATRTVRRQVDPGSVRRIAIPAQLGTTTVRELVEPARLEWRSVLCETNMTTENVRRVQSALLREGYNPGPVNGQLGPQTMSALNSYQRARNLPEDQYLNMMTVRALGAL